MILSLPRSRASLSGLPRYTFALLISMPLFILLLSFGAMKLIVIIDGSHCFGALELLVSHGSLLYVAFFFFFW